MADEDWAAAAEKQENSILSQVEKLSVSEKSAPETNNTTAPSNEESSNIPEAKEEITPAERSTLQKVLRTKLVISKNDVEIERKNPNSPLYSVKTFSALNLCPELLRGVHEMGFDAPSKIQETALPTLLADPPQNMIAQSQSGTGKTAAFVLAMLSRVNPAEDCTQALCLSPTYELALQIGDVAKKMAKFTKIQFRFAVRGQEVERGTKIKEHIIIGTPGKVLDWVHKFKNVDVKKLKVFVLDEADVMIAQQGHQDYSIKIHRMLPNRCQMMLFSATYDQEVMDFAEVIIPNAVVIRLKREEESLDNIKQYYVTCSTQEQKYNAIVNIYGVLSVGQAMIFCHTRKTASELAFRMVKDGHAVALLSGELEIAQRMDVLNRFRNGKEKVLITTNVLARGIDVDQVTMVINFDLPVDGRGRPDCETYLHRIGRTGRFGKSGVAINLVDGNKSFNIMNQIQDHFGKPIRKLDVYDVDEIEKLQD